MSQKLDIRELSQLYEAIVRDTNSAICVFEPAGRIVSFNKASLVLSGASEEEFGKLNFHNLESWKSSQLYEHASQCLRTKNSIEGQTAIKMVKYSQKTLYVQYTFSIIYQEEKEYLLLVLNDKTEEKMAEKAIAKAEQLSLLGELSAGIAHEINNPLTIILTLATFSKMQMAKSDSTFNQEKMKEIFEKIESTAKRMVKTVRSLRSISRATADDPFQPEPLKLILDNVVEITRYRLKSEKIELQAPVNIEECSIECHEGEVVQILVNLINNAFDALIAERKTEKKKLIQVQVKVDLDDVEIRVSDNGPGIPAEIRKKLMTPFFTTKPKDKGTGLGLSLSLKIAQRHGGTLFLDEKAKETCFVLRLPKKQKKSLAA